MVSANMKAPMFTLPDDNGKMISLADFAGKKVVVYFYPKDDTPGCTVEACSFRDAFDEFLEAGAVVLGISPDGAASHAQFRKRHNLPFYLLSDTDHKVAEAYGAWGDKNVFGNQHEGIIRSTFIIDGAGMITMVFPKVKPEGHAAEVLEALRG